MAFAPGPFCFTFQYPRDYLESFCWLEGLNTKVEPEAATSSGPDVEGDGWERPRPDQKAEDLLGLEKPRRRSKEYRDRKHHFYKYVPLALTAQAMMLYMPYRLWKDMERNR